MCPNGKAVKLKSRDSCPYLDDYEPSERSHAAPAVVPIQPTTDLRRTDVVINGGWDDTYDDWGTSDIQDPWTALGTNYSTRVPLHPQGCESTLNLLWRVDMVESARKAVAGDGVCIGSTYKDKAFVHPKTKKCRDLVREIVDEVNSHTDLKHICFTSI